eukprot:5385042-Prymnesium_polylepis.1
MSPLPFWLVGAQHVALNMSNNDLPVHFHYALFCGSGGCTPFGIEPKTAREPSPLSFMTAESLI